MPSALPGATTPAARGRWTRSATQICIPLAPWPGAHGLLPRWSNGKPFSGPPHSLRSCHRATPGGTPLCGLRPGAWCPRALSLPGGRGVAPHPVPAAWGRPAGRVRSPLRGGSPRPSRSARSGLRAGRATPSFAGPQLPAAVACRPRLRAIERRHFVSPRALLHATFCCTNFAAGAPCSCPGRGTSARGLASQRRLPLPVPALAPAPLPPPDEPSALHAGPPGMSPLWHGPPPLAGRFFARPPPRLIIEMGHRL